MVASRKSLSFLSFLREFARKDVAKRALSAAILIPVAVLAAYFGGPAFAALIAFLAVVMVFEWARMVEGADFFPVFRSLAISGAAGLAAAAGGYFSLAFVVTAIGGIWAGFAAREASGRFSWAAFGALYITMPCIALVWLRDSVENGRALTFMLFLIVWSADTGAYLAGRFIGGPRILRALSPEKTWSGVVGGVLMGAVAGASAVQWIYGEGALGVYVIVGACLGLASMLGDLAESAFKRIFGVKDSSALIPGHGGFLDRLDGMIFATLSMTAALFLNMVAAGV